LYFIFEDMFLSTPCWHWYTFLPIII